MSKRALTFAEIAPRVLPPIRVVVFEATHMGCELLSRALKDSRLGITTVPAPVSTDIEEAIEKIDADVAVISARLKDGPTAGFSLLKKLSKANPVLSCVMLLDSDDKESVIKAFRYGAVGVCQREHSCELLCKCVYSVHRGQVWANSQQLRYVLQALSNGVPTKLTDAQGKVLLSSREDQIVAQVADGLKNREIAQLLNISEHTVKNHLFRIFERLGISSRTELILYVLSHKDSGETFEPPASRQTEA
jgi:DNA-binding NarL/FixJ family response regulator